MTIKNLLSWSENELHQISTSRLDSELLLSFVLGKNRTYLAGHINKIVNQEKINVFKEYISRRQKNEPIAYIVGTAEFWGRKFSVSPDVLIPRPETERLVEIILDKIKNISRPLKIVDIGTGCGAIAITIAIELAKLGKNDCRVFASDVSPEIIEVAKKNADSNNSKVGFKIGNLLDPFNLKFDIIIANLPYVPSGLLTHLASDIKYYEPEIALDGGDSGTSLIQKMLIQAKDKLADGGIIFLEMWHDHGNELSKITQDIFPDKKVEVLKDLANFDRFLIIF